MQYDRNGALLATQIPELPAPTSGKVRDIFDMGDSFLFVASDRLSAFDVVMPNGIPDKGRVLTQLSLFWFDHFSDQENHLITADVDDYPAVLRPYADDLRGRSMLVKKCQPLPVECVARGYLIGSGWKDYQKTGGVCGIPLRDGYRIADKLDAPIFTPAHKAEIGEHDENITYAQVVANVGQDVADELRERTLAIYGAAADYARTRGIIIADTKFEFGLRDGAIILIDEVLTPDSSRFWPADAWTPGENPASLDKQYVRDYLETLDWGKVAPGPDLPDDVVERTREKYLQALEQISGVQL